MTVISGLRICLIIHLATSISSDKAEGLTHGFLRRRKEERWRGTVARGWPHRLGVVAHTLSLCQARASERIHHLPSDLVLASQIARFGVLDTIMIVAS